MSKSLILTEAKAVFGTFTLLTKHPAFLPDEIASLKEQKALSEARVSKLLENLASPILREDAQVMAALESQLVKEAIGLDRLTILEAASGLSVQEMVGQLHGMAGALEPLVELSPGVGMSVDTVLAQAQELAIELEDLEGAGMMREFRGKMGEFREVFAKLAGMVKGLVAVSDELHSGKLREILGPVLQWVVKRKKKMTSLLDTLQQYDAEVNKVGGDVPMKQGYFSKLFTSKAPTAGATNTAEQFKRAFEQIIASKAPSFAHEAKAFGADVMEKPIQLVFKTFSQFDDAVARNVDLDMLASMTKQSFGSALKNFAGGFFGGGRGMGVGMAGGGTAGRA